MRKPFDLNKALGGAKIITSDPNLDVIKIMYSGIDIPNPLVVFLKDKELDAVVPCFYTLDGKCDVYSFKVMPVLYIEEEDKLKFVHVYQYDCCEIPAAKVTSECWAEFWKAGMKHIKTYPFKDDGKIY